MEDGRCSTPTYGIIIVEFAIKIIDFGLSTLIRKS